MWQAMGRRARRWAWLAMERGMEKPELRLRGRSAFGPAGWARAMESSSFGTERKALRRVLRREEECAVAAGGWGCCVERACVLSML